MTWWPTMKIHPERCQVEIWKNTEGFPPSVLPVRILLVADGSCQIQCGRETSELRKSQILLLNSQEECRIKDPDHLLLAVILIDYYSLCNVMQMGNVRFHLDSREGNPGQYKKILNLLQDFLFAYMDRKTKDPYRKQGLYYLFLHELISSYLVSTGVTDTDDKDSLVSRMLNYIHTNYKSEISLNQIAEELFLTPSSASRIFYKAKGEKFVSYVKRIRLEHVCLQLMQTEQPVTVIAMENGFATPSSLNRAFHEKYGISPSEYREQRKSEREVFDVTEDSEEVRMILELEKNRKSGLTEETKTIYGEIAKMEPTKRWVNKLLSIGPMRVLASGTMQKQVLYLVDHLRVEYIHLWNVFSQQMMTRDEAGYNYTPLDEILDFCVDHRIHLMLDLSQRRDVAMASEKTEIYRLKSELVFRNAMEWMDALGSFLFHISKRYGQNIVGEWIFEFTFFQNDVPYYLSDQYSIRTVWEQGASLVKRFIPTARVAGPGLLGTARFDQMDDYVRDFMKVELKPDIFTSINFPYLTKYSKEAGSANQDSYERIMDMDFLSNQICCAKEWLSGVGFQGEFWITDWGFSIANRNYLQDSCFRGAFFLQNILKLYPEVDAMGIFYASDLLNVFKDSKTVLAGSGGILSKNGIRKPVYYALDFINRLGRYLITKTEECIITAETEREIQVICWNCQQPDISYYLTEENSIPPEQVHNLFADREEKTLDIILKTPLPDGSYQIKQRIVNGQCGSILNKWIEFNCSEEVSKDDMEYLLSTSVPEIHLEKIQAVNHTIRLTISMDVNEMRFISITKE